MASRIAAALGAAGLFASTIFLPAQAMMLSGRADMTVSASDAPRQNYSPVAVTRPPQTFNLNAAAGSQPSQYEGIWRCVSYVTNSSVAAIPPGTAVNCVLQFKINSQGRLMVYWNERGWSPADCAVVNFTPAKSRIVHKSLSLNNADWAALSTDYLHMLSYSQMQGQSTVVQYKYGRPIGEYETTSVLTRIQ